MYDAINAVSYLKIGDIRSKGYAYVVTEDPLFDHFSDYTLSDGTIKPNQLNFIVRLSKHSDSVQWKEPYSVDDIKQGFAYENWLLSGRTWLLQSKN